MPIGLPDLDGFVNQVEDGFVRSFRRELYADRFFSHTPTRDLSITTVEWRELSDAGKAKVTMEIPALEQSGSGTITKRSVEIPIFTKDRTYDGRAWEAYRRAGFDVEDARQDGLSMAEEVNDYLLFGGVGKSGTLGLPGPAYGLYNNPDRLTLDNSGTTNWNNPTDVSDDLSAAIKDLLVAGHTPERSGGYQLVMNPADSDLMNKWRVETDRRTSEMLPTVVGQPIWDRMVDQNTAYLIAVSPDNFDTVGPFSPGSVMTLRDDPGMDGLMMGKPIWVRLMHAIAPRIKRGDAVMEITFDRAG